MALRSGGGASRVARVAVGVAMLLAVLALAGWLTNVPALRSLGPEWVSMRPITCLAVLLMGLALWPSVEARWARLAQEGAALAVGLLGLATILEYGLGAELGLDVLLFRSRVGAVASLAPGRMAPTTAATLVLLAGAALAGRRRAAWLRMVGEVLALAAGAVASLLLLDYVLAVAPRESTHQIVQMAVNTAAAFLALAIAAVASIADSRTVRLLAGGPPGRVIVRRLLPAVLATMLAVAWLELRGEQLRLFGGPLGDALRTLAGMAVVAIVLIWGAAALNRAEARFRTAFMMVPDAHYIATRDEGQILEVNDRFKDVFGYDRDEVVGRTSLQLGLYANPEDRTRMLTELRAHGQVRNLEVVGRRKTGEILPMQLSVSEVDSGGRPLILGVVRDVSEQRRSAEALRSLEDQVRESQRLEAVGRLAGGVAHDFNNILTAITGYSDLLLGDLADADPKRKDVEEIRAAARRAATLTRQLLAFSRKQVLQPRVLDLNTVVGTLDRMLQRVIGEDVRLETALEPSLGAVRADPGQIEQVILNLAVNARDAMPRGGRLTIQTTNVVLDEAYAREHGGVTPGRYVMLAVSDTGVGMDAETRAHLFEPFFTTKAHGKGTGLGLATVYGIIKQSGGYIWVYSEPERGSTFKLYLPQVDAAPEAAASPRERPVAGGRETVLIAEDDASVREVAAQILTQKGYQVLRAPDGQTALEMAGSDLLAIDLLVTDLVMPGMTGRELASALSAERPGLRVLYMSGYTDDAVVRHDILEQEAPYLQKPFTPESLAMKVREVLDS